MKIKSSRSESFLKPLIFIVTPIIFVQNNLSSRHVFEVVAAPGNKLKLHACLAACGGGILTHRLAGARIQAIKIYGSNPCDQRKN